MWFSQLHGLKPQNRIGHLKDLRALQPQLCHVLDISSNLLVPIVERVYNSNSMFILGKNIMESVAKEGSLKIKEISYIHAEGYSASALKHGPFALLEAGVPVVFLIDDDVNKDKMMNAYEQVRSRGAYTIVITDVPEIAKRNGWNFIPSKQ